MWKIIKENKDLDPPAHKFMVATARCEEIGNEKLNSLSSDKVQRQIETGGDEMWASIRNLLKRETEIAVTESAVETMVQNLRNHARNFVEKKAEEEAGKVLIRMKDRFTTVFSHDKDSMQRIWTGKDDIRGITKDARSASLKLRCHVCHTLG
ncbi:Protein ROOT HAIR DEFECTIVE 3 [Euphorbia peplus]|nr:Protein ROOT HAIR DEFECTIVE 3 [Euphorbia peplus]